MPSWAMPGTAWCWLEAVLRTSAATGTRGSRVGVGGLDRRWRTRRDRRGRTRSGSPVMDQGCPTALAANVGVLVEVILLSARRALKLRGRARIRLRDGKPVRTSGHEQQTSYPKDKPR